MAADGLLAAGDVTATTTGSAVSYGGTGQALWLGFLINSASSNSVDAFIDITGGAAVVATTSASYRLRPGKSFPPYFPSTPGRNTGYSGFSVIQSAGTTAAFLYWAAWR